jgi:hypothetical protein
VGGLGPLVDDGEGEGEMVDIQPIGRGTTQAFVESGNGLGDEFGWRAGSEGTGTGGGGRNRVKFVKGRGRYWACEGWCGRLKGDWECMAVFGLSAGKQRARGGMGRNKRDGRVYTHTLNGS